MRPNFDNGKFALLLIAGIIILINYKSLLIEFFADASKIANGNTVESWWGLIPFSILMIIIAGLVRRLVPCPHCEERKRAMGEIAKQLEEGLAKQVAKL